MRRSLITAALALAITLLGFTVTAQAVSTERNAVSLKPGRYVGRDVQGQSIRFFFNGTHVSSFTIGSTRVGDAAVTHGGWVDVCHHGYCFNGSVTAHDQVHGSWRVHSSSHHHGWHANLQHISGGETH